ncbi:MAG: hypothetical protein QG575_1308 [Euryarchaeota archaeon]|nr:hypothetical protein [Euryarchaeota archaeon]
MASGMFLIQNDGSLIEMEEQADPPEDHLQELLATYPNLLAGNQIDEANPRRWLLISREVGLPSEEKGFDRWSVDHLFLDQDAIPTLVEVKRSSDTRIRREVVGQMLDYASNAVVYWPVETIRAKFEITCRDRGQDSNLVLEKFLNEEINTEEFWTKTKTNLRMGRVRMLFVANEIPPELRRIVEFLNEQMNPAEVLAVEIKQYSGKNIKSLIPRVFGHTQKPNGEIWNPLRFFNSLKEYCSDEEINAANEIMNWAMNGDKGLSIRWGTGRINGTFSPVLDYNGSKYYIITLWTNGSIAIEFMDLKKRPPFKEESNRMELLARLNKISGINISGDRIGGEPSIYLHTLKDKNSLDQFLEVFDWVVSEIKSS